MTQPETPVATIEGTLAHHAACLDEELLLEREYFSSGLAYIRFAVADVLERRKYRKHHRYIKAKQHELQQHLDQRPASSERLRSLINNSQQKVNTNNHTENINK